MKVRLHQLLQSWLYESEGERGEEKKEEKLHDVISSDTQGSAPSLCWNMPECSTETVFC